MTTTYDDLDAMTRSLGSAFEYRYRQEGLRAAVTIDAETRTLITAGSGYGTDHGDVLTPTMLSRPHRFIAEALPTVPITEGRAVWVEELDTRSGGASASAVPEAGVKPEAPIAFSGAESPLAKVDAYVNATTDVLEDGIGLRDYIDRRLMLHLLVAEDRDLMASFIANTAVLTQTFATSALATLTDAASKVEQYLGSVTGIGMNPLDYWPMVKANPTASVIDLDGGTVLGVPIVRSLGVPQGKALVGDFDAGAVIRERDTTVRFSNSHDLNFTKNLTTILAERRYLLTVHAPQSFAVAALA
jgi:hypothetical protein